MKLAEQILKKYLEQEEETVGFDFNNSSLEKIVEFVMTKISRKSMVSQNELYLKLCNMLIAQMKELPQGERSLIKLMKQFRSEM